MTGYTAGTMTLTVHLFAAARDLAGAAVLPIELPADATVADLRAALAARVPALAALLARSAVAVDHDIAADAHVLTAAAEVAVLPPVSGG
ncbi:MAG TPA: MoaD/ThiS family protein [Urbifossiella sp.]|nr:MoaD/ThiS family protein [Urbifossiella sp.]